MVEWVGRWVGAWVEWVGGIEWVGFSSFCCWVGGWVDG